MAQEESPVGAVKMEVSKSQDDNADFGAYGKTVDDAIAIKVKVGGQVIGETSLAHPDDAKEEAQAMFDKAKANAKNAGKKVDSASISHGGHEFKTEIVHDGFGGFHGTLISDLDGYGTQYHTDLGNFHEPHSDKQIKAQRKGEFGSVKQAQRGLQKRAEKLVAWLEKQIAAKSGSK